MSLIACFFVLAEEEGGVEGVMGVGGVEGVEGVLLLYIESSALFILFDVSYEHKC